MFLDSSALVAIILNEPEMPELRAKLKRSRRYTSAMVYYEAVLAVMRVRKKSHQEVSVEIDQFLKSYRVQFVAIDLRHASVAVEAFSRYGKGRGNKAALNMGDCFSYACARIQNVPILFKGNDFGETDIEIA